MKVEVGQTFWSTLREIVHSQLDELVDGIVERDAHSLGGETELELQMVNSEDTLVVSVRLLITPMRGGKPIGEHVISDEPAHGGH